MKESVRSGGRGVCLCVLALESPDLVFLFRPSRKPVSNPHYWGLVTENATVPPEISEIWRKQDSQDYILALA